MSFSIFRRLGVALFIGGWVTAVTAQTPVFEDVLTNSSKITGQRGSGSFSVNGYTLTQSVSNCSVTGNPRSGDFVYYELPRSVAGGSWAQGSIEWDLVGLGSQGCPEWNEHIAICDSNGLSPNPAWSNSTFYDSLYYCQQRKLNEPANPQHIDKMKPTARCQDVNFESRTNVLSWDAATTYRFRITWSGTQMRWYRGTPGQSLTYLSPPGAASFSANWNPVMLHIQLGSTFRAYRTGYSGGVPGSRYSLIRVYNTDLGNAATPVREGAPLPGKATNPSPANGAIAVSETATLGWTAGSWANTHKVYFGTSNPPTYRGQQAGTSYNPGTMELRTTYYWRIDEVNDTGTTTGDLWTFTTKSVTGDFDADTDVDLSDFGYLQRCFSGSGVAPISGCEYADLDGDNDVDANDFALFKNCFGGAKQPPGC